ncbi:unnamed protein product [Ectocarpus sp. 4 AP-2014]
MPQSLARDPQLCPLLEKQHLLYGRLPPISCSLSVPALHGISARWCFLRAASKTLSPGKRRSRKSLVLGWSPTPTGPRPQCSCSARRSRPRGTRCASPLRGAPCLSHRRTAPAAAKKTKSFRRQRRRPSPGSASSATSSVSWVSTSLFRRSAWRCLRVLDDELRHALLRCSVLSRTADAMPRQPSPDNNRANRARRAGDGHRQRESEERGIPRALGHLHRPRDHEAGRNLPCDPHPPPRVRWR